MISADRGGIDVWLGSPDSAASRDDAKILTGILCTFDTLKHDTEFKLLIGCRKEDIQIIRNFHKEMYTLFIPNPTAEHVLPN